MKEIKAYVRPGKLDEVVDALRNLPSVSGISVSKVDGFGSEARHDVLGELQPYSKLEIACEDAAVDELSAIIKQHAHTGRDGDGKIYISDVEKEIIIKNK